MYSFLIYTIILFFCIAIYWVFPWLCGRYLRLLLERNTVKENTLVLTFDDGPGSSLTPQILQILKEANIKATFFLLGINIPGHEDIVKQIKLHDHQIASHSYNHLNHWKVSPFSAIKDIKKGWQAIDDALGTKKGKYPFRPPRGKLNIISLFYLLVKKVPICYWTIVSGDTWAEDKRNTKHSASVLKTKNGGVILAHDFDRSTDNTAAFVTESLKKTITIAKENNMKIVTFTELCG